MAEQVDYDVVIIGAGISGINAAYRIQTECPHLTYTVIEARSKLGGTWDLFRYPGIRSDSDLHTFGFAWRGWNKPSPIAEAPLILEYLNESCQEYGLDKHIQFNKKISSARWSSKSKSWSLECQDVSEEKPHTIKARFILGCTGYYDYNKPLEATIPGIKDFKGQKIHPQFWPEKLDVSDKRVVIIGSGATAITLLPNVAKEAKEVIMLQRSPSYIMSLPQRDSMTKFLRRFLPATWVAMYLRFQFTIGAMILYSFCKTFPSTAKKLLQSGAKRQLPKHMQIDPNFNPRYNPWDQRLCLCPDGDFYKALHQGNVSVITDTITNVTTDEIQLKEHDAIKPDIIITATGLLLQFGGGIEFYVDGDKVDLSKKRVWNATLLSDLPNLGFCFGYTNASWTPGADCAVLLVTRLLNTMHKNHQSVIMPKIPEGQSIGDKSIIDLSSTYVKTSPDVMPRAGAVGPWRPRHSYFADYTRAMYGTITEGVVYS